MWNPVVFVFAWGKHAYQWFADFGAGGWFLGMMAVLAVAFVICLVWRWMELALDSRWEREQVVVEQWQNEQRAILERASLGAALFTPHNGVH